MHNKVAMPDNKIIQYNNMRKLTRNVHQRKQGDSGKIGPVYISNARILLVGHIPQKYS